MPVQQEEINVVRFTAECDRCGKEEVFERPNNGEDTPLDPIPDGWMKCGDPDVMGSTFTPTLTFHTRRCAVGYFRAYVAHKYGLPDPGEQDTAWPGPMVLTDDMAVPVVPANDEPEASTPEPSTQAVAGL
jgi:hypothetical protein